MSLSLIKVSKSFGAQRVVQDVSLTTQAGEFLALLGPSGCGKSTTLRMVAGLETPDAGDILIDGQQVTAMAANRRPVNMVFQSYALFQHLNVWDNVAYGLRRDGHRGKTLAKMVDAGLDLVRLTALAQRRPAELSGGQQQRVALARSLVKRPKALLLDEPLGALDPTLRLHMQAELKRIQKELGITFLYVAHHQDEAFGLADRVAVMSQGRLAQLDTPETVYRQPADSFVANFIGRLNALPRFEGPTADFGGDGFLRCPGNRPSDGHQMGVRPEAVGLTVNGIPADQQCWLAGNVADIIYRGATVEIEVDTRRAGRHQILTLQTADTPPPVGSDVRIHWRADQTMSFPDVAYG